MSEIPLCLWVPTHLAQKAEPDDTSSGRPARLSWVYLVLLAPVRIRGVSFPLFFEPFLDALGFMVRRHQVNNDSLFCNAPTHLPQPQPGTRNPEPLHAGCALRAEQVLAELHGEVPVADLIAK
jgi:hypothetical protein